MSGQGTLDRSASLPSESFLIAGDVLRERDDAHDAGEALLSTDKFLAAPESTSTPNRPTSICGDGDASGMHENIFELPLRIGPVRLGAPKQNAMVTCQVVEAKMKRPMGLLVSSLVVLLHIVATNAQAEECKVRVHAAGTAIQQNKIYSKWIISHYPWRWATISFRYRIGYIDESNEQRSIVGSFRQHITGREETYTELKNTRHHPTNITSAEYSDLTCAR
jgi:hypothetical protein